jgi:hypothetical protein
MSKEELIAIGYKIANAEGTEAELDELYALFSKNVPHPAGANLFFYPENYNASRDNIGDYDPSVEEIVDKCLSYRPIIL